VRIAPLSILILCIAFGLGGCSALGKKKSDASGSPSTPSGGKAPAKFPGSDDPILQGAVPQGVPQGAAPQGVTHRGDDINGILAGTVIDRSNRKPQDIYIRYVCLEEAKGSEAPIDVAVMPGGYFTIRGLQPNKQYKLIARAKAGDKVIAGVSYAKTPNIRVAIELRDEFAGAATPDVPGAPAYQPKKEEKSSPPNSDASAQGGNSLGGNSPHAPPGWMPLAQLPAAQSAAAPSGLSVGAPRTGLEPDLPTRVSVPAPPPVNAEPPSTGWIPGIASDKTNWPPLLEIPNKKPAVEIQRPVPLDSPSSPPPITPSPVTPKIDLPSSAAPTWTPTPASGVPARVPSCVLIGRQLHNLALNDTTGKPWEYKTQHQGKLVLLDFWATWCMPCRETIPKLIELQSRYKPKLEVVGIAYEGSGTPREQAVRVNAVIQRLQVNYRQLIGGNNCPVQSQFGIVAYPTLVLLDETGTIIWRHEGKLDQNNRDDLELLIQRQLGMR
jgi:thiol-disulfide isomerase/thioredoxin